MDKQSYVLHQIGISAAYEQLAEECCELAQAALKEARILRGENPTPVGLDVATDNLLEEVADVRVCLGLLGIMAKDTKNMEREKLNRWAERCAEDEIE